jgi:hypothetical protein
LQNNNYSSTPDGAEIFAVKAIFTLSLSVRFLYYNYTSLFIKKQQAFLSLKQYPFLYSTYFLKFTIFSCFINGSQLDIYWTASFILYTFPVFTSKTVSILPLKNIFYFAEYFYICSFNLKFVSNKTLFTNSSLQWNLRMIANFILSFS